MPIVLQGPFDERLALLAKSEADRDGSLDPAEERRYRYHGFTIDLEDGYWHVMSVTTRFEPDLGAMRVFSIGHQIEQD